MDEWGQESASSNAGCDDNLQSGSEAESHRGALDCHGNPVMGFRL